MADNFLLRVWKGTELVCERWTTWDEADRATTKYFDRNHKIHVDWLNPEGNLEPVITFAPKMKVS